MKHIYIILLCLPLIGFGQNVYTLDDIENTMSGVVSKTTKTPLSGELHLYYPTGKLHQVIPLKNGLQSGIGDMYYPSGELQKKLQFKNHKFHGFYEEYHKNGQLKTKGSYENGLEEGVWKEWDKNGELTSEFNGFKKGIRNGIMVTYFSWGKTHSVYENNDRVSKNCYNTRGDQISCE